MTTENIRVYKDLMGENEKWAEETRKLLAEKNILMINIIGSPGCGKTTLLEGMVGGLKGLRIAVLEGDVETTKDAQRIAALNIEASQLLTGGACHLEAKLVHYALKDLNLDELDVVVVENVGNLVCPAEFDIGEKAKIAVVSTTEGEDKPIKYPLLFREAKAILVTKTDLIPHIDFKLEACLKDIKDINSSAPIFQVSSKTGEGIAEWIQWINDNR
ncbi:MAG: hydrogenase nickel incorporation protein HypB [Planctomycetota bacterium]